VWRVAAFYGRVCICDDTLANQVGISGDVLSLDTSAQDEGADGVVFYDGVHGHDICGKYAPSWAILSANSNEL
jgi:hypothetical protein